MPTIHLAITDGFKWMIEQASFHWLVLMGALYIFGATIYMIRFPERCFPGKCDILVGQVWFIRDFNNILVEVPITSTFSFIRCFRCWCSLSWHLGTSNETFGGWFMFRTADRTEWHRSNSGSMAGEED